MNHKILDYISQLGYVNFSAFCKHTNQSALKVRGYINEERNPLGPRGTWRPSATRLADSLACTEDDLWGNLVCHECFSNRPPDPETLLIAYEREQLVKRILEAMTPREQRVIHLRFFDDQTLMEVGEELHITREAVRQSEAKALRKLRQKSRADLLRVFL
jgi:RNA polymerase sigma factor (sigma-70 family)